MKDAVSLARSEVVHSARHLAAMRTAGLVVMQENPRDWPILRLRLLDAAGVVASALRAEWERHPVVCFQC